MRLVSLLLAPENIFTVYSATLTKIISRRFLKKKKLEKKDSKFKRSNLPACSGMFITAVEWNSENLILGDHDQFGLVRRVVHQEVRDGHTLRKH